MAPSILYHCTCVSSSTGGPPPPHLLSSSYAFHPLHTLFFCEECDAVRCNRCVAVEVSGYYCPNCLFEVPSASVRAEKNRCARNCFLCPQCDNTLSVVPSDPPEPSDGQIAPISISAVGEPPFFLYCNFCRWDSAGVGITFDKPTGLALQLQKYEDNAPEIMELDRLKEFFEPALRASAAAHHASMPSSAHINPIHAAASSALSREIPALKFTSRRSAAARPAGRDKPTADELPVYKPRIAAATSGGIGVEAELDWLRGLDTLQDVAPVSSRWETSWAPTNSMRMVDLKPQRIPLHSKKSKRCPTCKHILIKPEQKAQSVRYKIKLVAANYLPNIEVILNPDAQGSSVQKKGTTKEEEVMFPGKTFPFHLVMSNPLYDPITVRVSVQRSAPPLPTAGDGSVPKRPPYAISLPTAPFPIAAFAEAWEYEDDEEMFDDDAMGGLGNRELKSKVKTVGVIEKRANVTKVGGEVVVSKEGKGAVKFNMLVSYTYRSDDPEGDEENSRLSVVRKEVAHEMKTFSFYTVVDLGVISPKPPADKSRRDSDVPGPVAVYN